MKNFFVAACMCLMLLIGLKDGRVIQIDGYPKLCFDIVQYEGKPILCLMIIIGEKAYPLPIEIIEGMMFVPDNKAV